MGHRAIQPAYPKPQYDRFVPHTPLLAERWTGVLEVLWQIDPKHPVVLGAGWFGLRGGTATPDHRSNLGPRRTQPLRQSPPELVSEIVRRGGLAVLSGSSLKGAVRQVYELLTASCRLERGAACRVKTKDSAPRICPACSLFGAAGLGGRLAFGEADPAQGAAPRLVKTPVAWPPRRWEVGTVRVYDGQKAVGEDRVPAQEVEPTWSVSGSFRSRLRLVNASAEELGLLFASLGLGAPSPSLRLGGKKYHGLGAVDVQLLRAVRRHPGREVLEGAALPAWVGPLVQEWVERVEPRRDAWNALHEALRAGRSV